MAWGKRSDPFQTPAPGAAEVAALQPEPAVPTNRDAPEESPDHCVGKSVQMKGDLTGDEDVRIDGRFEGTIRLADHRLVIGRTGRVQAEVEARDVIVEGQIVGDVTATDRLVITATGSVSGNLCAGRLVLVEGGLLKGSVEMEVPVIEPSKTNSPSPSPSPPSSSSSSSSSSAPPSPPPSPSTHSPASSHSSPPSSHPSPTHATPSRPTPSHSAPSHPTPPPSIAEPRDEGSFENAFPTIFDEKS